VYPAEDEMKCVGQGPVSEMQHCPNCIKAVRYMNHTTHQDVCKRTHCNHPSWPFKGKKDSNPMEVEHLLYDLYFLAYLDCHSGFFHASHLFIQAIHVTANYYKHCFL
jgi:hypothetical protein